MIKSVDGVKYAKQFVPDKLTLSGCYLHVEKLDIVGSDLGENLDDSWSNDRKSSIITKRIPLTQMFTRCLEKKFRSAKVFRAIIAFPEQESVWPTLLVIAPVQPIWVIL